MCMVTISVALKIQLFILTALVFLVPSVYSRCGCHRIPGQGFLTHNKAASNHNFEPLPQGIQPSSDGTNGQYSVPNFRVLLFQPTFLDFQEQPVGMPFVQSVVLSNPSDQNDIEIMVVNALPPFHASRFSKKMLPPLTNMTVDLVFLATMVGNVEHTVYIYTSRGNFPYQVFGVGLANPYRLRAFVSARIPVNGTFSPYINMYNPFNEAIQITEMYSSGSDLHLDLLGNNNNDSIGKLWEIPPYETKAVMRATFLSKDEGLAVRFIRIVIGPPVPPEDVLILPLEMLVSNKHGLYTNVDMLDFGTLRTMDEPKSLNLNALNIGNKSLQLLSIQVIPPNKAVSIQFTPILLKSSKKYTKIATVTYTALQASHKRQNSGKVIIYTTDEKKRMEVPYQANVLQGTLAYSVGKTSFFVGDSPLTQVLTITNTFNMTLVIYNATLPVEAQAVFSIVNFTQAILVPPGKLISPLSLNFQANESQLSLSTVLRLYTNASIFTIPVHCFNGKLKYHVDSSNEDVLDYGTVGTLENRSLTFKIINNNPIEVSIIEYGTHFEYARLRLLHVKSMKRTKVSKRSKWIVEKINETAAAERQHKHTEQKQTDSVILKPSDIATFVVDITAPHKEGTYSGEIMMTTIYEIVQIPLYLKTVEGSLVAKPKRIKIEKSFPGRTENYPISIESTFEYSIALKNLSVYPQDPRFQFLRPDFLPQLLPKEKTHIGWIKFDPFYGDETQCYLCICEIDPGCDQWHHSVTLPGDTWELDFNLLEKLRRKWDVVEHKQESSFNASIIIDSSVIKSYTIPVQASLAWPSLVEQSIKFSPTHVGNYSTQEMVITNPSDHPLLVQVVPLLSYPQPEGGLDLLSDRLIMDSFSLDLNGHSLFYLPELKDGWQEHQRVSSALNVYPSPNSLTMLLEPRQKKSIQIGFVPEDEDPKTSIMVVRNNLTILDLVVVHGQGARTYLNINGKAPGSKSSVLLFEIKTMHLKDCNKSTPKARVYPSFTVKRSFTAKNVGQLPVHVASMSINSYECEGYGFRILNCESFVLMPNASRKIDITFIPDFTTSRVTRTLKVVTTMGQSLDFTLLATLPHHLLPLCANALPRPFWEPYLHVIAAVVMSTVFIFIIFFAYFDAQKYVVQCTFTAGSTTSTSLMKNLDLVYPAGPVGTVFDLKAIGVNVRIDKKEKYNNDGKIQQRVTKTSSNSSSKNNGNITTSKAVDGSLGNSTPRERNRSFSDSSSTSSRKSSTTLSASPSLIPEEKPEAKPAKETNETPPKRNKRKPIDNNRNTMKFEIYEEPQEPTIIMEEIRDPWDREQIEKARLERLKQMKIKHENSEEGDKQKHRKKSKVHSKKEQLQHRPLQKETSNSSSNHDDDDRLDDKPAEFTTVESKAKSKKKADPTTSTSQNYGNTLDKLDEISLSGPRPDGKEIPRKTKNEHKTKSRNKKASYQQGREKVMTDTPTSPHAIAAAIVEAALVKSQQKKKNSPSDSNKGSPRHRRYEETSPVESPKKSKKDTSSGWGSYFKRFGISICRDDPPQQEEKPTTSGNSMFYYDNLSSLRASKQNTVENDRSQRKAPGFGSRKEPAVVTSTLSPDSAEFVPAAYRSSINKAPGSNLKKDNSWATVDDSALERLRPPPGLSKPAPRSIWGMDDIVASQNLNDDDGTWGSSLKNSSLFDFKNEGRYSSLLGGPRGSKDTFSGLDLLSSRGARDDTTSLWKSNDNEFSSFDKDLWTNTSTSIRPSIWNAPDPLVTTPTSGSSSARSRLGLSLDLKPVSEVGISDADSPLDPFSIWASSVDPVAPYEGWNQDIKEV